MALLKPLQAHLVAKEGFNVELIQRMLIPFDENRPRRISELLEYLHIYRKNNLLVQATVPSLYILEIETPEICSFAIVGLLSNQNVNIHPHENIHSAKKAHYQGALQNYHLQINPIMMGFQEKLETDNIFASIKKNEPQTKLQVKECTYKICAISDPSQIQEIQNSLQHIKDIFILDGHHRYSIVTDSIYSKNEYFAALFPSRHIVVKSIFRGLSSLPFSEEDLKIKLAQYFQIEPDYTTTCLYDDFVFYWYDSAGQRYKLAPFKQNISHLDFVNSIGSLYFQEMIVKKVINLSYEEYENILRPIAPDQSHQDICDLIQTKKIVSAFLLPRINFEQFAHVIQNYYTMPASSTWFEPKPLDRLICYHHNF